MIPANGNGNPMENNFVNFMNRMRGNDPNAIIQQMVQSGQLTQSQLDAVQQRARQITPMFDSFRKMFNF
jgi:hypothetical protein